MSLDFISDCRPMSLSPSIHKFGDGSAELAEVELIHSGLSADFDELSRIERAYAHNAITEYVSIFARRST